MGKEAGFTSMIGPKVNKSIPKIGIGLLGYAFMGKAHSNAYKTISYMIYPPPAIPKLIAMCGRNESSVAEAALRYGYDTFYTDWHKMLEDDRIQVFDNVAPNNFHAIPCIDAAIAGKHILCEKPLARTAEEAKSMLDAAEKAKVKHMISYNYRFVPAIRLARNIIESGALGQIYHYRAVYLQEWIMPNYHTPYLWRVNKEIAGSGSLGDLGSHIIDLAHFLVGDIKCVSAMTRTFIDKRPIHGSKNNGVVDVDDAFVAAIEFVNGAIGTLEATRFAGGHKNHEIFEINAEKGSIRFDLENLNELDILWLNDNHEQTTGFRKVLVTEHDHPWINYWWPQGHIIGWEHTFIHEIAYFLDCIVNNKSIEPYGASFVDGYKATVVCDAIIKSSIEKRQVDIKY